MIYNIIMALLIIGVDRITKYCALYYLEQEYIVNKYVYFQLLFNRGVSWGILNTPHTGIFIGVSLITIIITGILAKYAYTRYISGHTVIGELLVISGSLSNIADRFWYGAVIDFIVIHIGNWSWAVFNIADAAIVVGVFIMFVQLVPGKNA